MSGSEEKAEFLARRLLIYEANDGNQSQLQAASQAIEKLGLYLTKFVGTAGFQALLERAVVLAKAHESRLVSGATSAEHISVRFDNIRLGRSAEEDRTGQMALLTQLLSLLITFMGQSVTMHMVQEVWPGARLDDVNSSAKEVSG